MRSREWRDRFRRGIAGDDGKDEADGDDSVAQFAREEAETGIGDGRRGVALARGAAWLCTEIESARWHAPAPIGFYFAKLWYFEKLYPLIFATGALTALARSRLRERPRRIP